MTTQMQRTPNLTWLLVFTAVVLALFAINMAMVYTDHATSSHAIHIDQIDSCFEGPGHISQWFLQKNGRWLQFCQDGNGKYNFYRVYECEGNTLVVVTQFKQAVRKLARYLSNRTMGIDPAGGPPCQ